MPLGHVLHMFSKVWGLMLVVDFPACTFSCGQLNQPRLIADADVIHSGPGHQDRQYVTDLASAPIPCARPWSSS